MIDLILIRGLPSAGKTTLVNLLLRDEEDCDERLTSHFETDQFFMKDGKYEFDPARIGEAHQWCQDEVRRTIKFNQIHPRSNDHTVIVVSNTFTQRWEMQPYIEMGYIPCKLTVIDLFDGGHSDETLYARNRHGVPLEVIRTLRAGYEHDWRNGDPVAPWDRPEVMFNPMFDPPPTPRAF